MKKTFAVAAFIYGCASIVALGMAALWPLHALGAVAHLRGAMEPVVLASVYLHLFMFGGAVANWGAKGWPPVVRCTPGRARFARVAFVAALAAWAAAMVAMGLAYISDTWAVWVFTVTMSVFIAVQWGLRPENVFGERFVRRWNPSRAAFGLEPVDEKDERKSDEHFQIR